MIILREPISVSALREQHNDFFETMVKIVVDLERELIAVNAELHADLEQLLLEEGSTQEHLWGANVYFEGPQWIEFTSLINIRPAQGNKGMQIEDSQVCDQIKRIIERLIQR